MDESQDEVGLRPRRSVPPQPARRLYDDGDDRDLRQGHLTLYNRRP